MCNKLFSKEKILKYQTLSSTNDFVSKLLKEKEYEIKNFTVIWAENQTKGRGQKGNSWVSEAGKNLTFSILYFPKSELSPLSQFLLNQTVSLGIIDFLRNILPPEKVFIKWPNDIYAYYKKIAGILIENQVFGNEIKSSIIGIGININQTYFSNELANATSLNLIKNVEYDLEETLIQICSHLEKRFQNLINFKFESIKNDYLESLIYYGEMRDYYFRNKLIKAKIIGINELGKLQLISEKNVLIDADIKEIVFIF